MKFFFIFMREILPILIVLILKIFRRFMISDNDLFDIKNNIVKYL